MYKFVEFRKNNLAPLCHMPATAWLCDFASFVNPFWGENCVLTSCPDWKKSVKAS